MRILITGAQGFVGSRVWPHLVAAGHDVFAVTRKIPSIATPDITWIACDLLEAGAPQRLAREVRADTLIHLAWTVEHGKFWTDPANLDWVAASLTLARAVAEQGAKRIVATGTCFEYDWPASSDCNEATTPLAKHTLYDIAKNSFRAVLAPWAAQSGVSLAWARLFYLYGAGEHPARLVADVARNVIGGRPADCSSGLVRRDFIDVRDAGRAIAALALSEVSGAVNIASGEAPSIAEIARMIGEIAGQPDLVRIGARPDRPGEPPRIVADIARLTGEVGYRPQIALREGLHDAVEYWRSHPSP